ncbi:MAG: DUF4347 domain-containing protein [Oscillatoriales cyanobacterium SM2_1_8]|nr:DUF4347 domain-containing protein [Oscillatoriales cyanobacterium SM2_1_8]
MFTATFTPQMFETAQSQAATPQDTLVLIDSQLQDVDVLQQHLLSGVAVHVVSPTTDVLELISQLLAQTGAKHLAIVAHGQPGMVHIGRQPLTSEWVQAQRGIFEEWCLQQISLYSCHTAQGTAGAEFLTQLHTISGASLAAASYSLGHVVPGGRWHLDVTVGETRFGLPWDADIGHNYRGTLAPVTLPIDLFGPPGVTWSGMGVFVNGGSGLNDASIPGQRDAFDGALGFSIDGVPLTFPPDADLSGSTLTIAPIVASGLNVSISFYADPNLPVLRSLVSLQNPSGVAVNVVFNLQTNVGSDSRTQIIATSSGDMVFEPGDRWIITDDDATSGDPTNTHVLAGLGGLLPSTVSTTVFSSSGTQGVNANYNLSVPAGGTQSLLFFNALHPTALAAQEAVTVFDSNFNLLSSGLLTGLSSSALLSTVNFKLFDSPNVPGSGVLSRPSLNGDIILGNNSNNAIAGTNLNDTIAAFAGDDVVFGFGGNDSIDGGLGNDFLNGGEGNDTLIGSVGNNTLTGDIGNDVFVVRTTGSFDTITDFEDGADRIRTVPTTTFSTAVGASFLNAIQNGADTVLSVNGVNIARLVNFTASNFSGADL